MQWERQIADIVQLVSEEKNARSYLQSVAKRLVDDVEGLKSTASTIGRVRIYMYMYMLHVTCTCNMYITSHTCSTCSTSASNVENA